tara:strand:- start:5925 stop:8147 length:2223 start_codon:yes stop_codon:yes gene_type:complete
LKSHKSLLAKLLANEDINVEVAPAATASFNPVTRTIRIPPWKDLSNDTHDLFLGHEVGHALYTPTDGWHDAVHNYDFPKSYVNIVEDIRIEKNIQKRYPGLRNNFIGGYKELLGRDFFGINKTDVNTISFMNRLNIKSKCRDLLDVKFSKEELVYVKKAYNCETFDDVIAVCEELHKWLQEKNEKAQNFNEPESEETCEAPAEEGNTDQAEEETTEGGDTDEEAETEEDAATEEETEEETDDTEAVGDTEETDTDAESEETEEESSEGNNTEETESLDPDFDYTDATTDDTFRDNEEKLVSDDANSIPKVINIPAYNELKPFIVSWQRASELRTAKSLKLQEFITSMTSNKSPYYSNKIHTIGYFLGTKGNDAERFAAVLKTANANAESLVKEFERKKSAWQSQRTQESKKGCLNMSKLHNYKFSEDIFMSNLNMPNYKSHGLVSLIDFSGSMNDNMITTITQAYILAIFAKRVGIKFNISSFTSSGTSQPDLFGKLLPKQKETDLNMNDVLLVEQFTDEMNKAQLVDTFNILWKLYQDHRVYQCGSACDHLGGTPLDSAMAATISVIDNFKSKNRLQKVSFISITDGETSMGLIKYGSKSTRIYYKNKFVADIDYTSYHYRNTDNGVINNFTNYMSGMGVTTIEFFITKTLRSVGYSSPISHCLKANKEFRNAGIVQDKSKSVDAFYYMRRLPELNSDNYFDAIDENSKKGELSKALKTMGQDRIFARSFAKTLAEVIA